jgi:hypothetical protein
MSSCARRSSWCPGETILFLVIGGRQMIDRSRTHAAAASVDGHQDLPNDGHAVDVMAITESDRIPWSSRREICSESVRRSGLAPQSTA